MVKRDFRKNMCSLSLGLVVPIIALHKYIYHEELNKPSKDEVLVAIL